MRAVKWLRSLDPNDDPSAEPVSLLALLAFAVLVVISTGMFLWWPFQPLQDAGLPVKPPLGSIYIWAPTPGGRSSAEFAAELLDEAAVVVSPGTGYGAHGEGFFRISLTVPDDRLHEAMGRIRDRVR